MDENMQNSQNIVSVVEEQPMTVGDWIVTMLLMLIPIANIVLLFVWAFGSGAPKSKSNWAKAGLIFIAISIILYIIMIAIFGSVVSNILSIM